MNNAYFKLKIIDLLINRDALSRYQQLIKSEYYSYDKLCSIQNDKLKKLVHHAYKTVGFYKKMMDDLNIKPEDIKSQEDLKYFPIITKETINKNRSSLVSSKSKNYHIVNKRTGGSTGQPLSYMISRKVEGWMWGSIWRAWNVNGYMIGDKVCILGGSSLLNNDIKHRFYHYLNNWTCISIVDLSDDNLKNIFSNIKNSSCKMIYSYPTPLYMLACYMDRHGLKIPIDSIVTTSEMLFPEYRKVIESVFDCKIQDTYGANDGGVYGFECEYFDGYHLSMEKCITEVVDDEGAIVPQSTVGNLVLTDLENYVMPFIRYAVGDRASITNKPCQCQRGLNRIENISGRIKDFVELESGMRIDGSYFTKQFRELLCVELFQIIQKTPIDVFAKVRINKECDSSELKLLGLLEKKISEDLGIDFKIQINNDFIKKTDKFQYIVKEI